MFFGRNDAKAETPVLWPPHVKSWLIGKDSDARRDWGQEEKGTTEDEMAGWHHRLDGREFVWTPGDGDGQGGLACCDSWGRKESDTTERLNWTEPFCDYCNIQVYQIIMLHTLDIHSVICQLYLNKAEKDFSMWLYTAKVCPFCLLHNIPLNTFIYLFIYISTNAHLDAGNFSLL